MGKTSDDWRRSFSTGNAKAWGRSARESGKSLPLPSYPPMLLPTYLRTALVSTQSPRRGRVAVFIDGANLECTARQLNIEID